MNNLFFYFLLMIGMSVDSTPYIHSENRIIRHIPPTHAAFWEGQLHVSPQGKVYILTSCRDWKVDKGEMAYLYQLDIQDQGIWTKQSEEIKGEWLKGVIEDNKYYLYRKATTEGALFGLPNCLEFYRIDNNLILEESVCTTIYTLSGGLTHFHDIIPLCIEKGDLIFVGDSRETVFELEALIRGLKSGGHAGYADRAAFSIVRNKNIKALIKHPGRLEDLENEGIADWFLDNDRLHFSWSKSGHPSLTDIWECFYSYVDLKTNKVHTPITVDRDGCYEGTIALYKGSIFCAWNREKGNKVRIGKIDGDRINQIECDETGFRPRLVVSADNLVLIWLNEDGVHYKIYNGNQWSQAFLWADRTEQFPWNPNPNVILFPWVYEASDDSGTIHILYSKPVIEDRKVIWEIVYKSLVPKKKTKTGTKGNVIKTTDMKHQD